MTYLSYLGFRVFRNICAWTAIKRMSGPAKAGSLVPVASPAIKKIISWLSRGLIVWQFLFFDQAQADACAGSLILSSLYS